jgi:hypothetical protein
VIYKNSSCSWMPHHTSASWFENQFVPWDANCIQGNLKKRLYYCWTTVQPILLLMSWNWKTERLKPCFW